MAEDKVHSDPGQRSVPGGSAAESNLASSACLCTPIQVDPPSSARKDPEETLALRTQAEAQARRGPTNREMCVQFATSISQF